MALLRSLLLLALVLFAVLHANAAPTLSLARPVSPHLVSQCFSPLTLLDLSKYELCVAKGQIETQTPGAIREFHHQIAAFFPSPLITRQLVAVSHNYPSRDIMDHLWKAVFWGPFPQDLRVRITSFVLSCNLHLA